MNRSKITFRFLVFMGLGLLTCGCSEIIAWLPSDPPPVPELISRAEAIPPDAVKMSPESDLFPPILHSAEWFDPVPLEGPINTAGAEDSPFVTPDGQTMMFFFTPDVRVPAERQIVDGATGIYLSRPASGSWSEPERVILQDPDKLSLDGCEFLQGDLIWFCSARVGNYREVDFYTATYREGAWTGWENAGERLNVEYGIGELHLTTDLQTMVFHSPREGGLGGLDIWITRQSETGWTQPVNLNAVNTEANEGWPFISQDGMELWFNRDDRGYPAIYRSRWTDAGWGQPELIMSQFAGEPTLDSAGNLYFVHHYFIDGKMIEADIYVAYRRGP